MFLLANGIGWKGPVASDTSPFCLRRCFNIIGRNFKVLYGIRSYLRVHMAYPPLSTGLFYVAFALLLAFLERPPVGEGGSLLRCLYVVTIVSWLSLSWQTFCSLAQC
jgi:hypothetical protein